MIRSRWILALGFAALVPIAPASAQQARLDVRVDPPYVGTNGQACDFSGNSVGTATITIRSYPFKTIRFKAPPPCGIVAFTPSGPYPFEGNINTGIEIVAPSCVTENVWITTLTIPFIAPAPVSGCTWDVQAADGDVTIELTDCDGFPMTGASARSIYCGDTNGFIAPYKPYPANGATNVPLNTLLSYTGRGNVMRFGEEAPPYLYDDEVCDLSISGVCDNTFDPGLLKPFTTYYWQMVNWCGGSCPHGEGAVSDVWSFTTGDQILATEPSTWGAVKARYRE